MGTVGGVDSSSERLSWDEELEESEESEAIKYIRIGL